MGPRLCVSNKLPGDTEAAGPHITCHGEGLDVSYLRFSTSMCRETGPGCPSWDPLHCVFSLTLPAHLCLIGRQMRTRRIVCLGSSDEKGCCLVPESTCCDLGNTTAFPLTSIGLGRHQSALVENVEEPHHLKKSR